MVTHSAFTARCSWNINNILTQHFDDSATTQQKILDVETFMNCSLGRRNIGGPTALYNKSAMIKVVGGWKFCELIINYWIDQKFSTKGLCHTVCRLVFTMQLINHYNTTTVTTHHKKQMYQMMRWTVVNTLDQFVVKRQTYWCGLVASLNMYQKMLCRFVVIWGTRWHRLKCLTLHKWTITY